MITPVILCGGIGSRLWPVSRSSYPKQFLKVDGIHSLFQKTILRVKDREVFAAPIIICNENYKFKIAAELEELGITPSAIIVEPEQKNTCPAISLAAHYAKASSNRLSAKIASDSVMPGATDAKELESVFYNDKNSSTGATKQDAAEVDFCRKSTILILPSDHLIKTEQKFIDIIKDAAKVSNQNLITFGITPTHPATGYGYIEKGDSSGQNIYKIKKFTEKPSEDRANSFIKTGNHYWNSGMFLLDTDAYLLELKALKLELYKHTKLAIENSNKILNFVQIDAEHFSKCENISIDYAIFENTTKASLIPTNIDWCDLGNWKAFYDHSEKDADNNVLIGNNILSNDSHHCLVYSHSKLHTVLHKVDNISLVVTDDAILVINKDFSEEVKDIYNGFRSQNNNITEHSKRHYRPWGSYEDLQIGEKYRVKLIQLNPHSQISLQYHNKRAEHWVITKGTAKITKGDETFLLKEDEYVYIPIGTIHRIENTSNEVLEFIETQIGEEVVESDIVRLEDKYARIS